MTQETYQEMNYEEGVHAGHPVPDELLDAWRSAHEDDLAARARHYKLMERGRPTEEERKSKIEIYEPAARNLGIDVEKLRYLRNGIRERNIALSEESRAEEEAAQAAMPDVRAPLYLERPLPERADTSFWWARHEWGWPLDLNANLRSDGLHFWGTIFHHSGDLRNGSFEYRSFFELQPDRIPSTPTGRYLSAPHMELFGRIEGYTGDCDITTGDIWSKCWMHRRQKLFQPTFGGVKVLGERLEVQNLYFLECDDGYRPFTMPGRQNWPAIVFNRSELLYNLSIWAEMHLFFHFQLEGHGAHLKIAPDIIVRGFQWPLLTG
jgi:hypothetical protein